MKKLLFTLCALMVVFSAGAQDYVLKPERKESFYNVRTFLQGKFQYGEKLSWKKGRQIRRNCWSNHLIITLFRTY